jgi:hypothetical protein
MARRSRMAGIDNDVVGSVVQDPLPELRSTDCRNDMSARRACELAREMPPSRSPAAGVRSRESTRLIILSAV